MSGQFEQARGITFSSNFVAKLSKLLDSKDVGRPQKKYNCSEEELMAHLETKKLDSDIL